MGHIILVGFCIFAAWLIRRDVLRRPGVSPAIWIPTLWAWVVLSRPMSSWLGVGGGVNSLEGSPLDRLYFLALIVASLVVLVRRRLNWTSIFQSNWPVFLFYGFFLISVVWAYSSEAAFKRWFKDLGNVWVALVILTELNPAQAIRAVFWRCAILLVPLSFIFLRWFPHLGRRYSPHTGGLEVVGVTTQKNELGPMIIVCGIVLIWDWIESRKESSVSTKRLDVLVTAGLLASAVYLLYLSDSKTSVLCLLIGAVVLFSHKIRFLQGRVAAFGRYALFGGAAFYLLNEFTGIAEVIVTGLGRDMTFTGRTEVWRELFALDTDPLLGVGFCSFWSDPRFLSRLPSWVAHSAHNGYIEMYLDGGWIGVALIATLLIASWTRIDRALRVGTIHSLFRFAVLLAILIGCFSESHFARMSPLWFLFFIVVLEPQPSLAHAHSPTSPKSDWEFEWPAPTRNST